MLDLVAEDLHIQQVARSVICLQVSRLPAARENAVDVGNAGVSDTRASYNPETTSYFFSS